MMKIQDVKDRTHRCVGCSQCFGIGPHLPFADGNQTVTKWKCPTLEYYHFFSNTARAKAYFAREVVHDKLELNEELANIFFSCPDCGCCELLCPPIPHMYISRAIKVELREKTFIPSECIRLNDNMGEKYNLFGINNENRAKWAKELDLPKEGDVLYFAGCYASFRQVKTAWAMVDLLRKGGINPAYLAEDEWCCGLHAGFSGDTELERKLASHNVEAIQRSGAKSVILSCANCYRTVFSDYPRLIGEELPFKVIHAVEVLPELMESGKVQVKSEEKVKVTLHDPCHFGKQHIGRHHELYDETRQIIKELPNVDFEEMEYIRRWSACCGGGNSVTSSNTPEFTDYHSTKRCQEAKEVADVLLTPCVRCVENLSTAARKQNIEIEVKSLLEFVADRVE
jgi:heterodisulfide reductase subunit D